MRANWHKRAFEAGMGFPAPATSQTPTPGVLPVPQPPSPGKKPEAKAPPSQAKLVVTAPQQKPGEEQQPQQTQATPAYMMMSALPTMIDLFASEGLLTPQQAQAIKGNLTSPRVQSGLDTIFNQAFGESSVS